MSSQNYCVIFVVISAALLARLLLTKTFVISIRLLTRISKGHIKVTLAKLIAAFILEQNRIEFSFIVIAHVTGTGQRNAVVIEHLISVPLSSQIPTKFSKISDGAFIASLRHANSQALVNLSQLWYDGTDDDNIVHILVSVLVYIQRLLVRKCGGVEMSSSVFGKQINNFTMD